MLAREAVNVAIGRRRTTGIREKERREDDSIVTQDEIEEIQNQPSQQKRREKNRNLVEWWDNECEDIVRQRK